MKSLSCKDLAGSSSTSCNFTATGETADDVKNKIGIIYLTQAEEVATMALMVEAAAFLSPLNQP